MTENCLQYDVSKMLPRQHQNSDAYAANKNRRLPFIHSSSIGSSLLTKIRNTAETSPVAVDGPNINAIKNAPKVAIGYSLMRCQEVLKLSDKPLHTHELQLCLGNERSIVDDPEFLALLKEAPRVNYDSATGHWSYKCPLEKVVSAAALKAALKEKQEYMNGLEITQELTNQNTNFEEWVQTLLRNHEIRAIRATRNVRCKNYTPESGIQCDLYESGKCTSCNSLKGIIIYSKENGHLESIKVDPDIKELWLETTMPNIDVILEENNISRKGLQDNEGPRKKKRRPPGARAATSRISKILNTHIYSVDDFKQELQEVTDDK